MARAQFPRHAGFHDACPIATLPGCLCDKTNLQVSCLHAVVADLRSRHYRASSPCKGAVV